MKNTILLAPHHDLSCFCSEDESRYVLRGVHYNANKKRLEASDGRLAVVLPVLESGGEYPFPPCAPYRVAAPLRIWLVPDYLAIVLIDGGDLKGIILSPCSIVDVFSREAKHAMNLKTLDL